jgi:Flp pilus assembly pilin Flp
MKRFLNQVWQEDDGVLSFEWVLLITLLAIGIVGGIAASRDAIIDELGDIAEATINFDQSYFLPAIDVNGDGDTTDPEDAPEQFYTDDTPVFTDVGRSNVAGQGQSDDSLDGG